MQDIMLALGLFLLGLLIGSFASFSAGWKKAEDLVDNEWKDDVAKLSNDFEESIGRLETNLERLREHLDSARERMIK